MQRSSFPSVVIDGRAFNDFAGFVRHFSDQLIHFEWSGSLDAFNDILRGGCGTPDGGFQLLWMHSQASRSALGWTATIRWLDGTMKTCHPSNAPALAVRLDAARRHQGSTLFEWIIEIVNRHGPEGEEPESNVRLLLL